MPNQPFVNQTRTILLAPDDKNSIHTELAGGQRNSIAYAPYGHQSAQQKIASLLAFNGELFERKIRWYFLGNGYRVYNPILMRFHSPDSWSPFGQGGLNAYMYCGGDPRNFTDPTGHMLNGLKLFGKSRKTLAGASNTSSLSPPTSNAAEMASTAPPKATSNTIPALAREAKVTKTSVTEQHFIDYGPWRKTPLPTPSKQKPPSPYFNDTGGQVSYTITSLGEAREGSWGKEAFRLPHVPLPPIRVLSKHSEVRYSLNGGNEGYPVLKRLVWVDLEVSQSAIRDPKQ